MRERHGCEKKDTESRPLYRGGNPKKIYNRFQIGKKIGKLIEILCESLIGFGAFWSVQGIRVGLGI